MKRAAPKQQNLTTSVLGSIVGIVLAYAFLSRAFSTGSYWHYLLAVIFLVLGVRLGVKAIKLWKINQ